MNLHLRLCFAGGETAVVIFSRFTSLAPDPHFSNETGQVQRPVARLSADTRFVVYLVCLPRRDVTAWKNACSVGTRNYRPDTTAAATSRKICFPFHSIARRVYFTADHHHVERINICQRYYDRATLHFLELLSRSFADVLLKFLEPCVSDARSRFLRLFKFPRGKFQACGSYVFTTKMLSEKKETKGKLVNGVMYNVYTRIM